MPAGQGGAGAGPHRRGGAGARQGEAGGAAPGRGGPGRTGPGPRRGRATAEGRCRGGRAGAGRGRAGEAGLEQGRGGGTAAGWAGPRSCDPYNVYDSFMTLLSSVSTVFCVLQIVTTKFLTQRLTHRIAVLAPFFAFLALS